MLCPKYIRRHRRPGHKVRTAAWGLPFGFGLLFVCSSLWAQNPANNPASLPAGAIPPPVTVPSPKPATAHSSISAKQAREADDSYLDGAKQIEHKNIEAAERDFARAVQLNPNNRDYVLALLVTRENRVTELVQSAAKARLLGNPAQADSLLEQARTLDPKNPEVLQHFSQTAEDDAPKTTSQYLPAEDIASTLAGPVEFAPKPGKQTFHVQGDTQSVLRSVYSAFGIDLTFDNSVSGGSTLQFDLKNVSFEDATNIVAQMTHTFAVAVQPKTALIVKDTQENRDQFQPQVEETIYLPGFTQDQMTELANLARNVFDVKTVTASATGGFILMRGDEKVLRQVNAVYADMLDGGSEVLFDVTLYEIDITKTTNLGATLPTSIGAFDLAQSAQSLITANQSLIAEAIQSGALSSSSNLLVQLAFLIAAGVSGASQFTNLLGTVGTYDQLPLAGLSVAAGTTFNVALNSSDVRTLDAIKIRSSNKQTVNFRAGTRYPVITATYSSGVTSSLASSLAGLTINGQSASSLLSQYLGSGSSTSVPQFQFEDLGITLKMTPQILHNSEVSLALEMKIEALGGGTIDSIPILNNRALTSTITVPVGQTAMLATLVNTNEMKSLDGLPGLSELPGFQGTEQDREKDSDELLITITPHIVRSGRFHVESRRLAAIRSAPGANLGAQ
jgi:general secretion pathway protein D